MNTITIHDAWKMTSPNPITLVCTKTPEGKTNLAAVSWWMYTSSNPAMLCFAMGKKSFSGEMVRQNKEVVLAMPSAAIADDAFKCGTVSGRSKDKAKEFGIELMELPDSPIMVPKESRLAFSCGLNNFTESGDHYLYICNIQAVYGDKAKEQIFAWEGYAKLAPLT